MADNSKRSGFSPVLAFILGFLLALIIVIGAVAGAIFYALNFKLDKLEFNKDEENNYIFVNADPNGETATVLQLVNKVLSLTQDTSSLTIEQVEGIFPVAGKLTATINDTFGEYVEIDVDELKKTKFSELGTFLQETVMEVRPAALLDKFGGELGDIELLNKVLYDSENNPVTLRQITDGSALENLKQTPVLDILGDGKDDYDELTHKFFEGMTVGDLMDNELDFKDKVNALTLDMFISVTVSDGKPTTSETLLSYVVYGLTGIAPGGGETDGRVYTHTCTYNTFEGEKIEPCYVNVEDGKITEVFYVGADGVTEVESTRIIDINKRTSGITQDLTVGQIIDVSGNRILEMIGGSTIASLSEDINNLSINELYAENIYSASAKTAEADIRKFLAVNEISRAESYRPGWIYYIYQDGAYKLADTTGKITEFEDGVEYYTCGEGKILFDTAYIYYGADGEILNKGQDNAGKAASYEENLYTYGAANAMWKLLLYSNGSETAFSVNGFMKMIDNVSENIEDATIYELDEAGIIDMSVNKDSEIKVHGPDPESDPYGKKIGELTLKELLDFFSYIVSMTTIPTLPNIP